MYFNNTFKIEEAIFVDTWNCDEDKKRIKKALSDTQKPERPCYLCGEETVNKYCENTTCEVYIKDEE